MDTTPHEYKLAQRARDGDRDAIAELVARTRTRLFEQAYADLGHYDDAQDAIAAALVKVCTSIQQLHDPRLIVAWIRAIVRNEARMLRRRQPPPLLCLDEAAGLADGPLEDDTDLWLLRLEIEQALRELPGQQARALRLFYLEGFSVRGVARRMSGAKDVLTEGTVTEGMVTEGMVKMWLLRGRRQLAVQLEGYAPVTHPQKPNRSTPAQSKPAQPAAHNPRIRRAAILHTDLAPETFDRVMAALREAGYTPHIVTPSDLGDFTADQMPLRDALMRYGAIVLDEQIGGRTALEYVLFCKAYKETLNIPLTMLHAQEPDALMVTACYAAGVQHLVRKDEVQSLATVVRRPPENEEMARAVSRAGNEARRTGDSQVCTEHLLLGILGEDDPVVARLLAHFGISLEPLQREIECNIVPCDVVGGGKPEVDGELPLAPRVQRVLDLAEDEAQSFGRTSVCPAHVLLALIREGEGLAGRILFHLGARQTEEARRVVDQPEETEDDGGEKVQ